MSFDKSLENQPPKSNTAATKLLDSTLPPPPPSPARHDFAAPSPAISQRGNSTASSSFIGFSNEDVSQSPATTWTTTTTGSLDALQLPPSSLPTFIGGEILQNAAFSPGAHFNIVPLAPPDIVHFSKGSQSFKLAYERMHVCQTAMGEMRHIELSGSDPDGFVNSAFIHTFPYTVFPVPHMETPMTAETKPPYVMSFLDSQMVNASGVAFSAQPHYYFSNWQDCLQFQEALLGKRVVFVAGMNKARSKGRGEESISQNVRLLKSHSGETYTILFFANSQPKANKRYLWLSGEGVDSVERKKDTVILKLNPDALEVLSSLRTLYIEFLNSGGAETFCSILNPEYKGKGKHKGKGKV